MTTSLNLFGETDLSRAADPLRARFCHLFGRSVPLGSAFSPCPCQESFGQRWQGESFAASVKNAKPGWTQSLFLSSWVVKGSCKICGCKVRMSGLRKIERSPFIRSGRTLGSRRSRKFKSQKSSTFNFRLFDLVEGVTSTRGRAPATDKRQLPPALDALTSMESRLRVASTRNRPRRDWGVGPDGNCGFAGKKQGS